MDKKIIDILQDEANKITTWDDEGNVLDWEIEKNENFLKDVTGKQCPICNHVLVSYGDKLYKFKDHAETFTGAEIKCSGCGQDWYIHYKVIVPKMEDMEGLH